MSGSTGLYRLLGAVTNIRPATAAEWTVSLCPDPLIARFEVRIYSVAGIMGDVPIALDSLRPVREYVSMSSTSAGVAVTNPVGATGVVISVAGNAPITLPLVRVLTT